MKRSEPPLQPASGEGLREFYVKRLERLVRLRGEYEEQLNPLGVELLERSIYATFRDCVDTGAAARARTLIGGREPRSYGGKER
jgi:hypothetical protein